MSGFSNDGQWWWDGQTWVATPQVVIPELAPTERARQLEPSVTRYRRLDQANLYSYAIPFHGWSLGSALAWPWLIFQKRAFRAYREWALEQTRSAAAYLLGPDEPAVAAEVALFSEILIGKVWGGNSVVVTGGHVLILANDTPMGHPQRVLLAAHPDQVSMRLHAGGILNAYPTILVTVGGQTWAIKGMNRVIQPEPVITAWWQLATARRT